jgi:hypothetical protein
MQLTYSSWHTYPATQHITVIHIARPGGSGSLTTISVSSNPGYYRWEQVYPVHIDQYKLPAFLPQSFFSPHLSTLPRTLDSDVQRPIKDSMYSGRWACEIAVHSRELPWDTLKHKVMICIQHFHPTQLNFKQSIMSILKDVCRENVPTDTTKPTPRTDIISG